MFSVIAPVTVLFVSFAYIWILEVLSKREAKSASLAQSQAAERSLNVRAKIYEARSNNIPIHEREAALKRLAEVYGCGTEMGG